MTATTTKQPMTWEQIIELMQDLSHSQGFYQRLLNEIKRMEDEEPDKYESAKRVILAQEFTDPVDLIMFFDEL